MFTKIKIYCSEENACFNDIKTSEKPTIIINIEYIVSLSNKTNWGFCKEECLNFPYRILRMTNGESYLCVLESANELEKLLLSL